MRFMTAAGGVVVSHLPAAGPAPRAMAMALAILVGASSAIADFEAAQVTVDRYLQAGDLEAAERFCRQQLASSDAPLLHRAAFTVELLRVLEMRLRASDPADRADVWETAREAWDRYRHSDQESPWRLLTDFQAALLRRAWAELALYESPVAGDLSADDEALDHLRQAIVGLKQLAEEVQALLRVETRERDPAVPGWMSRRQLRELQARVELELGRAYLLRAESYAAGSNDALLAAEEGILRLSRLAPNHLSAALWWDSRLSLIACLRLKQDWSAIADQRRALSGARLPERVQHRLWMEAVRAAIAQHDWTDLRQQLAAGQPQADGCRDDVNLALIDGYLALADQARAIADGAAAADWEQRAAGLVEEHLPRAAAGWQRRVERLLTGRRPPEPAGSRGGFQLQLLAAQALYREGHWQAALSACEQAAQQATGAQVIQAQMTRAAILAEQLQAPQAIEILRDVARQQMREPLAAQAHRLSIQLAARQAELGHQPDLYPQLLHEHLELWPRGPEADRVRQWRGRWAESAGRWAEAMQDYLAVAPEGELADESLQAVDRWLSRRGPESAAEGGDPLGRAATVAALDRFAASAQSQGQAWRAVRARRSSLRATLAIDLPQRQTIQQLERWLADAVDAAPAEEDGRAAEAGATHAVLAAAHARHDDWAAARRHLDRVERLPAADWLWLLEQALSDSAPDPMAAARGAWAEEIVRRGAPQVAALEADQQLRWQLRHAQALIRLGRAHDVVPRLESLRQAHPLNAEVHVLLAEALAADAVRKDWQPAIRAWQEVARNSRPGSPVYFQARYGLAEACYRNGELQRATDVIRWTRALHPDLGGPANQSRFEALLQRCQVAP